MIDMHSCWKHWNNIKTQQTITHVRDCHRSSSVHRAPSKKATAPIRPGIEPNPRPARTSGRTNQQITFWLDHRGERRDNVMCWAMQGKRWKQWLRPGTHEASHLLRTTEQRLRSDIGLIRNWATGSSKDFLKKVIQFTKIKFCDLDQGPRKY